jgi:hypothetical protein
MGSDYDELDRLFDTDPLLVLQRCRRAEQRLAELGVHGDKHLIKIGQNTWVVQHSLACRESGDLFECKYTKAAEGLVLRAPGIYTFEIEDDGTAKVTPLS